MLPALTGTNRMADHDIKLGAYVIPRNTMIWCSLNAMFSSPSIWDEPEKYRPVRNLSPGSAIADHDHCTKGASWVDARPHTRAAAQGDAAGKVCAKVQVR